MTGYTRQELSERFQGRYIQLIHPDDRQFVVRTIKEQLDQNKTSIEVEYRIRCKDGSIKWILERGQLESDEMKEAFFVPLPQMLQICTI